MNRRVQLGLILPMMIALCLAALPSTDAGTRIEADVGAQASPNSGDLGPEEQPGPSWSTSNTLLAELDMPFFSFAGITRARL